MKRVFWRKWRQFAKTGRLLQDFGIIGRPPDLRSSGQAGLNGTTDKEHCA